MKCKMQNVECKLHSAFVIRHYTNSFFPSSFSNTHSV